MKSTLLKLLVALFTLSLVAAACGSDDDTADTAGLAVSQSRSRSLAVSRLGVDTGGANLGRSLLCERVEQLLHVPAGTAVCIRLLHVKQVE